MEKSPLSYRLKKGLLLILASCILALNPCRALCKAPKNWDDPQVQGETIANIARRVNSYIDHLKDVTDFFKQCDNNNIASPESIKILENSVSKSEKFLKEIEDLKNKSIKQLGDYFYKVLKARLANLKGRRDLIMDVFETPEKEECVWGPTHPDLFSELDVLGQLLATLEVNRFQITNQAILELASFFDLREMSARCKDAIAASPSLWSLLQGLKDDLVHTDETILKYPEKAMHYAVHDNPGERKKARCFLENGDVARYEIYLEESMHLEMYSYTSFHKEKREFKITPYELQFQGTKYKEKHQPLELPDFLEKPARLVSYQEEISEKTLEQKQIDLSLDSSVSVDAVEIPSSISAETIPTVQTSTSFKEKDTSLPRIPSIDAEQDKSPKTLSPKRENSPKSASALHVPQMTGLSLKGKMLNIYQRIFSTATWKNISFKDFKGLWEHLGGEVTGYKSGGSHRTLKFQGKSVGGTFVPHGTSCYGPRSLKYLREALENIGYGAPITPEKTIPSIPGLF